MKNPLEILQKYWGYTRFRPLQEEIIQSVLEQKDTVALLPTGGGKSLCFQLPALAQDGICLVISPLIALMNDQVKTLTKLGIKSIALTGGLSHQDVDRILDNCIYGNYKFLYLSPERLQQELVQYRIEKMQVNLIAVDEAHCISQWGNDFRPAYKNIKLLRKIKPKVPFIALTATATPEVLTETIAELNLDNPQVFKQSFYRENLAYQVWNVEDKHYQIEQLLKKGESAIIYARSRKNTEEIHQFLQLKGFQSQFFHGGITPTEKKKKLNDWLQDLTPIMVSTSAFGMGIDKARVRTIIHTDLPESLESYFQEAGRAGRDGNYAQAIILCNEADKIQVKRQFLSNLPTKSYLKLIYKKLCNHFYIAYGEGQFTTHSFSFEKFCQHFQLHTLKTYNAIQTLDRLGVIKLSFIFGNKTQVQFLLPSKKVITYLETNSINSQIGKTILRLYSGIFDKPTGVDLELIASKSKYPIALCIQSLQQFEKDKLISLKIDTTDTSLTFIEPREDDRTINRIATLVEDLNVKKEKQINKVIQYIDNENDCKSIQLLTYFGEQIEKPCGICSVCTKEQTKPSFKEAKLIAKTIVVLLEEKELNSRELCEKLTFAETKVLFVIQQLLEAQKIIPTVHNKYALC